MLDPDTPDQDALDFHAGPGSPVKVAINWLAHAYEGDLEEAWPLTHDELRDALAKDWAGDELDAAIVAGLSAGDTTEPAWDDFAAAVVAKLRSGVGDFDVPQLTWLTPPDLVSPESVQVFLVQGHRGQRGETLGFGTRISVLAMSLRLVADDGWRVVALPRPGPLRIEPEEPK